jgi:PTH1 family peptidyl-tRNA hydrolase
MAFLQKKPQVQSGAPLYSIGANKTVLIVGLGNPGKDYEGTRHNIGFAVLNDFAAKNDFPNWIAKKDLKCQLAAANLGENRVILCKPLTFMNNSGEAAHAVQRFYRVYNQNTLAVYDELAIPFGSLRSRLGGSDAGHNGVKSLTQHLGEDYGRLRIGIGSEMAQKADSSEFVLGKFTQQEQADLPSVIKEASAMITEYIFSGQLPHVTRTIL